MTQNEAPQEGPSTDVDAETASAERTASSQVGQPTERLEGMHRVREPHDAQANGNSAVPEPPPRNGAYGPPVPRSQAPQAQYPQSQYTERFAPQPIGHTQTSGGQGYGAHPESSSETGYPAGPRTDAGGAAYSGAPHPGTTTFGEPRASRPRKIWPTVVGTAAVTALLVGGGTAAALVALLDDGESASVSTQQPVGTKASKITVTDLGAGSWEAIAAKVAPSVVAIQVKGQEGAGQGSGFILDEAGHILTNDHVVTGAVDDTVQVALSDGRLLKATIVGLDPTTDLAVIVLVDPPSGLTPVTIANSDDVVVGNAVMAVGNPLGLANTVTTGIISAIDRPVATSGESSTASPVVTNAIQIDAAVNPGNSGGPLFNASGEVIGITSSIASLSTGSGQAGSIGLGFAIPANLARSIGDQLIKNGIAEHAVLGVAPTDETATADGETRLGAGIQSVSPDSPAEQAGLKVGDVIVALDGEPMSGAESLAASIRERGAGDVVEMTVVREGKTLVLKATLAAQPGTAAPAEDATPPSSLTPPNPQEPSQDPAAPNGIPDDFFDWFNNR